MKRLNKKNKLFTRLNWVLVAMLILSSCNTVENKKSTSNTPVKEIQKVETVKSDYMIPENLKTVWNFKDGYTAKETTSMRNNIGPSSGTTADNEGSFMALHLSEVMATAKVHRSGDVSNLKVDTSEEIKKVGATTLLGTMTLEEMMADERARMKGIVVIHDGKIVFEQYPGMREWDNHLWASATKIFNGILAYVAEKEGVLDVSKPITEYIPELKGTQWEGVKVEDALHQRSGMDISEHRLGSSPTHPVTMFYRMAQGDKSLPKDASLMDAMKVSEKILESGKEYVYASINTNIITTILQNIYNKPFEEIITEKIWSKTGMEGDALLGLSPSGEPMAFGIYASRLRDLARFGMLFTPSWKDVSKEQIVDDEYFAKAMSSAMPEAYGKDYMSKRINNDFGEANVGASYQWDAVFTDGDMYKSGRTGQCLYVSPETNTVVVWFSSAYNAEFWAHAYAREIVNQLYR